MIKSKLGRLGTLTTDQHKKLNQLQSDSLDLFFELTDENKKAAELVLLKGVDIDFTER